MNKPKIWFSSSNIGKIKDIQYLCPSLKIGLLNEIKDYTEPEETGTTFLQNAIIKAKSLSEVTQAWVIADDSGFCVEALNNFPGVHSKRWAYPETDDEKLCELLLYKIKNETDMSNLNAYFETCIVLYNAKLNKQHIFSGICQGVVGDKITKGKDTFAYDWIFKPKGFDDYFAFLASDVKRSMSARGVAIKKMIEFIESEEFAYD